MPSPKLNGQLQKIREIALALEEDGLFISPAVNGNDLVDKLHASVKARQQEREKLARKRQLTGGAPVRP